MRPSVRAGVALQGLGCEPSSPVNVAKHIPEYLKLHTEEPPPGAATALSDELSAAELLCCAFERTTGWRLQYEPAESSARHEGSAAANGAGLLLSPARRADDERFARLPRAEAEHLATAIAIVLGELQHTRSELARREAELATAVPVAITGDDGEHISLRLQASLSAAAQAVGAQAACLYLLDDGTSELKLRACHGLPQSRLLAPPRALRGAIADLEALLGHAVVIEDTSLLPHWRCPEDFPAAVCIPVSSANTPLGTLWVFSETSRDFSPTETNLLEVIAGRIAAELEREVLTVVGEQSKSLDKQLDEAARWQSEHLPTIAPLVDDWDVAGATQASGQLASEFFDWSVTSDGQLAIAMGDAHGRAVAAGLSSAALQATVKSHAMYRHDARQMLERVNETLWTASPGGQYASLFYGLIDPEQSELDFASAGRLNALLLGRDGHQMLARGTPPLGSDPELVLPAKKQLLLPGTTLLVLSDGVLSSVDDQGRVWNEEALVELLGRIQHLSASELIARLQTALGPARKMDRTLLVCKRLR